MSEYPISEYARALRSHLPTHVFAPAPGRALWLLLHVTVIAVGVVAIGLHWGGWPGRIVLSALIGHSFAGAAFVAHEVLHGSIVRGRRARQALGWLGFLPFGISPTLWVAWHNRVHHGHTGQSGVDPDTYPTLDKYRESRAVRVVDRLSIGGGRWAGLVTLFFGFSGQSAIALGQCRTALGMSAEQRRAAILHTATAVALWGSVGLLLGLPALVFAFVVPLMIGNAIVMAYILTNHSLSPLTTVNDPLLNSLSVTAPRVVETLHLNFGFHVEHHLFPAMSPRHAREVRELVRDTWPERYQSMPLGRALRLLWITPRIYEDATTLYHPRRGDRVQTLLPRRPQPQTPSVSITERPRRPRAAPALARRTRRIARRNTT